ncbi:MAG: mechanosensitive ion channel family protein [Gammaproteobacteria bacterium]|nr:mechanosensitive ion channel family protein [Gammaproteobacteria bacterium]
MSNIADFIHVLTAGFFFAAVMFLKNKALKTAKNKLITGNTVWEEALISSVKLPSTMLIWLLYCSYTMTIFAQIYPEQIIISVVNNFLKTSGIIVLLAWFLISLIKNIEHNYFIAPDKDSTLDLASSNAMGKLLKALVVFTATILILQSFGYSLSGLLTIGGAGSLIMGLAAKDMLANFFGGLTVNLDKPFKVGDSIKLDSYKLEGVIEKIGWRTTRLKNGEKCPVYIPNSIWSNVPVENVSRMSSRRIKETIGLRYEDSNKLKLIIDDIEQMLLAHSDINQKQPVVIKFYDFGVSSLNLNLLVYTRSTKLKDYLVTKEEILFAISDIVHKHKAKFAVLAPPAMA